MERNRDEPGDRDEPRDKKESVTIYFVNVLPLPRSILWSRCIHLYCKCCKQFN